MLQQIKSIHIIEEEIVAEDKERKKERAARRGTEYYMVSTKPVCVFSPIFTMPLRYNRHDFLTVLSLMTKIKRRQLPISILYLFLTYNFQCPDTVNISGGGTDEKLTDNKGFKRNHIKKRIGRKQKRTYSKLPMKRGKQNLYSLKIEN